MLVAKNAHSFNIGNYAKDKQNIRKRIKSNHLSSFSFYFICFVLQNMQIHKSFTFFAIVANDDPCFHFLWTVKRFKLSMRKGQKTREKNFCTLTSYKFSDTPSKPIKNKLTKHFFYLELNDLFDGMKEDCETFWLVINFCQHLYIYIIQLSIFPIVKINLTSCPPPPLCHILFVCEICIKSVLSDSVKI